MRHKRTLRNRRRDLRVRELEADDGVRLALHLRLVVQQRNGGGAEVVPDPGRGLRVGGAVLGDRDDVACVGLLEGADSGW